MQDSNNENIVPTYPNRGEEKTVPVRPFSSSEDEEQTKPIAVISTAKKPSRTKRWLWVIVGILGIFLFAGAGTWIGYQSALNLRTAMQEEKRVDVAKEHFMAGLVAQQNKQYEIARTQFEYVIRIDPNFPGAQDKLREVIIAMSLDRTPTPAPTVVTPTLTPTKDTRPQEEIYNQALQQYAAQDWEGLFATIDSLRRIDPKFRAVEIDGMLYMALRHRGIQKILHQANLEGGLYDLALAERFGPLDVDALGYRNWARQYLNGASFWEVDWERVTQYFEEIYPYFPNMRDSSGMTAIERYRIAARSQGDKLMAEGDGCAAYDYYMKSLNAVADGEVQQKADEAYLLCHPPTATPTPTTEVTPTLQAPTQATQETPVEVPTATPTQESQEPPEEPTTDPEATSEPSGD